MIKNIYGVSQVNQYIKNMFAQDFMLRKIAVKGEVSNCKYHTSGHIYFTIKDENSALAAVMFAGYARGLNFRLKEGDNIVATGSVQVYERDGKYQFWAHASWGFNINRLLKPAQNAVSGETVYRVFISCKFTGSAYVKNSKNKNAIYVDRAIFIKQ